MSLKSCERPIAATFPISPISKRAARDLPAAPLRSAAQARKSIRHAHGIRSLQRTGNPYLVKNEGARPWLHLLGHNLPIAPERAGLIRLSGEVSIEDAERFEWQEICLPCPSDTYAQMREEHRRLGVNRHDCTAW